MEHSEHTITESDFSGLEGTCCYCSEEAATKIRQAISGLPLRSVHMIGTGDYHYVSLFWLERIEEPFTLVLFDNHPDDQPPAFGEDILSCGSWVAKARLLPLCRDVLWIREKNDFVLTGRLDGGKCYISVDLDILSPDFARTDWSQGDLTTDELVAEIKEVRKRATLIGADICGGLTEAKGATDDDFRINRKAERALVPVLAP